MQTITKRALIDRIATTTGFRRKDVTDTLAAFVDVISEELARGNRIEFRDLGVFETKVRAPRTAQNPKTLQRVAVPQRRSVKFKPGMPIRQRLERLDAAAAKAQGAPAAPKTRKPTAAGEVEIKPAAVVV